MDTVCHPRASRHAAIDSLHWLSSSKTGRRELCKRGGSLKRERQFKSMPLTRARLQLLASARRLQAWTTVLLVVLLWRISGGSLDSSNGPAFEPSVNPVIHVEGRGWPQSAWQHKGPEVPSAEAELR
eukprot:600438-Amphidinium_carterae.1